MIDSSPNFDSQKSAQPEDAVPRIIGHSIGDTIRYDRTRRC